MLGVADCVFVSDRLADDDMLGVMDIDGVDDGVREVDGVAVSLTDWVGDSEALAD